MNKLIGGIIAALLLLAVGSGLVWVIVKIWSSL